MSNNKKPELTAEQTIVTWEKKDGTEIRLNCAEATIEKAKSLGWKRVKD